MAIERTILRAVLVLFALGGPACATKAPGTDGETHFVCSATSDCAARGIAGPCVGGACVGSGDGSAHSAGDGSGNSADATTLVDSASTGGRAGSGGGTSAGGRLGSGGVSTRPDGGNAGDAHGSQDDAGHFVDPPPE